MKGIPVASWMRASFKGCFKRPAMARSICVMIVMIKVYTLMPNRYLLKLIFSPLCAPLHSHS